MVEMVRHSQTKGRDNGEHKLRPTPARQSSTLPYRGRDGGRNFGFSRTVALPETANRQRATTQAPQGLDATHGSELFPVNESWLCLASIVTVTDETARLMGELQELGQVIPVKA